jgi:uncharacterized protein YjiS (DUF1127 family)
MQHVIVQKSIGQRPGLTDYVRQVGKWIAFVRTAMTVARERRNLLELNDRMLKDIGIGRSEAYYEASRPFGDIPTSRLERW